MPRPALFARKRVPRTSAVSADISDRTRNLCSHFVLFAYISNMPAARPPIRAHPAKPFRTITDAAKAGQIVEIKCNLCRRGMNFMASDLAQVIDPNHPIHIPPFACSKCKTLEYVHIDTRSPSAGDVGRLPVRKLMGQRHTWVWKSSVLGD